MELLPKEIQEQLPKLYATEHIPTSDKIVQVKYFTHDKSWTWYAVEYCPEDKIFFGFVKGLSDEWGYFGLNEFESINSKETIIIRDENFKPTKFKDLEK